MTLEHIDNALLVAHADGDKPALAALYKQAGQVCLADGNIEAGCFYLTHAYIFALDCGQPDARDLHRILVSFGREQ